MPDQIDHRQNVHMSELAGRVCRLCTHVTEGGTIQAFGFDGGSYSVACSQACLGDSDHTILRADCLLEQHPEMLPLFHLPMGGYAVRSKGKWMLGVMEPGCIRPDHESGAVLRRSLNLSQDQTVFVLRHRRSLYEKILTLGARFAPFWQSEKAARQARNANFLDRVLFRVHPMTWRDFTTLAIAERHNYVARKIETQWEVEIIDPTLNIDENTLLL